MLATQSIRFSNEYIEFWKLNSNFPQTNQKCNRKIAPTTDHQKRPKLSRKREPKKKDFVRKRKAPSFKLGAINYSKCFFPWQWRAFLIPERGKFYWQDFYERIFYQKLLTLFSKWRIIIMRQLSLLLKRSFSHYNFIFSIEQDIIKVDYIYLALYESCSQL